MATEAVWTPSVAVENAHEKPISSAKFSRCGRNLATSSADGSVRIWSTPESPSASMDAIATLKGHEEGVSDVAWSPDASLLASASDDKTLRVWDVAASESLLVLGEPRSTFSFLSPTRVEKPPSEDNVGHSDVVFSTDFNAQGSLLASASFDESIRLWDVRTGRCVRHLVAHQSAVTNVSFSTDGSLLVTSSYDGLVRVWDVASQQCMRTLYLEPPPSPAPVGSAVFAPNMRYVLSSALDGKLRLWDYVKEKVVRTYQGHVNDRFCLRPTFVRDGGRGTIACGSEDGRVCLWDTSTGAATELKGHEAPVLALASHPTEELLASAGGRKLQLWQCTK